MTKLKIVLDDSGGYNIHHPNGVLIGQVLVKEDGMHDFWPILVPGTCWPAYILKEIVIFLEICNQEYERFLDDY